MPTPASSSLRALRQALRKNDRPVMVHWILLGALTNLGVLLVALSISVWLGNRAGVDFSVVDRERASHQSFIPMAWLLGGAMSSFPISGFLVSKASNARSVYEPAVATIIAIAAVLVTFGFAAPKVLALALIASPVAFVLAAAGAWFGLSS